MRRLVAGAFVAFLAVSLPAASFAQASGPSQSSGSPAAGDGTAPIDTVNNNSDGMTALDQAGPGQGQQDQTLSPEVAAGGFTP